MKTEGNLFNTNIYKHMICLNMYYCEQIAQIVSFIQIHVGG